MIEPISSKFEHTEQGLDNPIVPLIPMPTIDRSLNADFSYDQTSSREVTASQGATFSPIFAIFCANKDRSSVT